MCINYRLKLYIVQKEIKTLKLLKVTNWTNDHDNPDVTNYYKRCTNVSKACKDFLPDILKVLAETHHHTH